MNLWSDIQLSCAVDLLENTLEDFVLIPLPLLSRNQSAVERALGDWLSSLYAQCGYGLTVATANDALFHAHVEEYLGRVNEDKLRENPDTRSLDNRILKVQNFKSTT